MTLLINDIYTRGDLRDGYILTVADRRISYPKGHEKHHKPDHMPKVFEIKYLNATIGYFGQAEYRRNKYSREFSPLSPEIESFITHNHKLKTIGEFARTLRDRLNYLFVKDDLKKDISGFHICGYNDDDIPEFWVVRNIGDDYNNQPFLDHYICEEKFLSHDAAKAGYNGKTPVTGAAIHSYYINGDPAVFHHIWEPLGQFVDGMIQRGGFGKRYTPLDIKPDEDLRKIAEWQMKVISSFFSTFGKPGYKTIGGRPKALVVRPKGAHAKMPANPSISVNLALTSSTSSTQTTIAYVEPEPSGRIEILIEPSPADRAKPKK